MPVRLCSLCCLLPCGCPRRWRSRTVGNVPMLSTCSAALPARAARVRWPATPLSAHASGCETHGEECHAWLNTVLRSTTPVPLPSSPSSRSLPPSPSPRNLPPPLGLIVQISNCQIQVSGWLIVRRWYARWRVVTLWRQPPSSKTFMDYIVRRKSQQQWSGSFSQDGLMGKAPQQGKKNTV